MASTTSFIAGLYFPPVDGSIRYTLNVHSVAGSEEACRGSIYVDSIIASAAMTSGSLIRGLYIAIVAGILHHEELN